MLPIKKEVCSKKISGELSQQVQKKVNSNCLTCIKRSHCHNYNLPGVDFPNCFEKIQSTK